MRPDSDTRNPWATYLNLVTPNFDFLTRAKLRASLLIFSHLWVTLQQGFAHARVPELKIEEARNGCDTRFTQVKCPHGQTFFPFELNHLLKELANYRLPNNSFFPVFSTLSLVDDHCELFSPIRIIKFSLFTDLYCRQIKEFWLLREAMDNETSKLVSKAYISVK